MIAVPQRKMYATAALGIAISAAPAQSQENREFRDWAAYCDALAACTASTHDTGTEPQAYLFKLTRKADDTSWNLVLEVNAGLPERPFDIHVDLKGGSPFSARVEAETYGRPNDLHLLGANAKALMEGLGPASEATFEFIDADGDLHEPRFSLSGLSASLLWIDEKQGLIGSPREAGEPPRGLAPADATPALPEEVRDLHERQDDCEAPEDLPDGDSYAVFALSDDVTLYLVPCYSGAYNFARAAYTGANGYFERQWFADYSTHASWTATNVIVNPEWDPATKRLTMFNRGRGLGDCGSIGEWQSHDGFLRLEKFFYKGECDAQGEPGVFPLVYEATPLEP